MIDLKTLGELELRGSRERELCAILAQPKRLALLIYLATCQGRQRRDSLVALFWPDLDTEHARGALRQALRFLRRELGEAVLNGHEDLGFQPGTVSCDATAFERACQAGRLAEALALYRGDFLDGFFVSDAAPEFDYWVEGRRARLRSRAVEAARTLAEHCEAAGDSAGAIHWARRAFELSPDEENTVRRLVMLLDRLGERAAAVRMFQDFARRLAEQDVQPSRQTQDLIRTVHGARAPTALETPELALARAWFLAGWCGSCARDRRVTVG